MPNLYLSQGDLVRLAIYEVMRAFFNEPTAARVLPARLEVMREGAPQPPTPGEP